MSRETSITIDLEFPVQLPDTLLEQVTIRRASMGEIKKYKIKGEDDVEGEMRLFSALTGLNMQILEKLDPDDYERLQDAFVSFRRKPDGGTDS